MAADMLGRNQDLPERGQRVCRQILSTVDYMSALVQDLTELGRLETHGSAAREAVDLAELCREVIEVSLPRAADKGLDLQYSCSESAELQADRASLLRLVDNLLSNAIKYTPSGGRVELELSLGRDELQLQVRDTGLGIPEEAQARVFERFYRVPDAAARAQPGTGLGLAICQGIARAHGGRIELQSRPGEGSCFSLHLPHGIAAGKPG